MERLSDHAATIVHRLLAGRPGALALDFDGTLTEIVADPSLPRLTPERREVVAGLAGIPTLRLAVVSGRGREDVAERLGVAGVETVGNHGFDLEGWCPPGGDRSRRALQRFLRSLAGPTADRPAFSIEDKGATATLHLLGTRADAARDGLLRALQLRLDRVLADEAEAPGAAAEAGPALRLHPGKASVEVRPGLAWDKARALEVLLARWGVAPVDAFYAGDDVTDECVFAALHDGVTVKVGGGESSARYVVEGPEELYAFLRGLLESARLNR
ncbi:MAG: trehalose-phosphatase [Gemmatimonadota bacterium]